MNNPDDSPGKESSLPVLGVPSVIKQWDEHRRVHRKVECTQVGQLAFSETMFFVLEGKRVQGYVYLAEIQSLALENRKSFRHPVVGAIVGAACILAPISAILGDPLHIGFLMGGGMGCMTVPFLMFIGLYTLYEVVRLRDVPWLVIRTAQGERAMMLKPPLKEEERLLIDNFSAAVPPAEPPTK